MCPFKNEPDCFNCPLPDCAANTKELSRQDKIAHGIRLRKKEQAIVDEYLRGASNDAILMRFHTSTTRLKQILSKAGVEYKPNRRISVQ